MACEMSEKLDQFESDLKMTNEWCDQFKEQLNNLESYSAEAESLRGLPGGHRIFNRDSVTWMPTSASLKQPKPQNELTKQQRLDELLTSLRNTRNTSEQTKSVLKESVLNNTSYY